MPRPSLLASHALAWPINGDVLSAFGPPPVAGDVPSRLQVLQALTRKFTLGAGLDLAAVAACCGDRCTAAVGGLTAGMSPMVLKHRPQLCRRHSA